MASYLKIIEHFLYNTKLKVEILKYLMSHIFPCNSNKNKSKNKKYTSNERKYYVFHEKIPKTG